MTVWRSSQLGWTAGQDVSQKFAALVDKSFKAGDTFVLDHMYKISGGNHQLPDNFTLAAVKGGGLDVQDTGSNKNPLIYLGNGNKLDNVTIKHGRAPDTGYDGNNPSRGTDFHTKKTIVAQSKNNIVIENSKFEGNVETFVDVRGGDNLTVRNSHFDGAAYQMRWLGNCTDFRVDSTLFQNALIDGIKTMGNSTGTQRATINNSVFENGRDGLDTTGGFKDSVVSNSIFRNNSVTGIDIKSPYHDKSDFSTDRANTGIRIDGSEFINNNSGIVVTFTDYTNTVTASTADKWAPHNITVTDSIFEKTADHNVGVRGFLVKAGHNIKWSNAKLLGGVDDVRITNQGEPSGWNTHDVGGTSSTGPARSASKSYPFVAGPVSDYTSGSNTTPDPEPEPEPDVSPDSDGDATTGDLAINAGGKASGDFSGDSHFSGGSVYGTGASFAGTSADAVYNSERWGDFGYSVPIEDGTHDVTLKFAEIYFGAAGQRLFDVRAEGKLVLDNFDVYAAAGGKNIAVDKTIRVNVEDGRLNLDFTGVRDNAKISGIAVDAAGSSTAEAIEPKRTAAPEADENVAINAGGKASGDALADTFYFGGKTYATGASIANTSTDAVYQNERWGDFRYSVPVDNGTYDVELQFAELYWNAEGKRVFDVKAEGKTVLDDFDIVAEAGGKNIAHNETIEVDVADGKLDLSFVSIRDNAKISGIEISPSDGIDVL